MKKLLFLVILPLSLTTAEVDLGGNPDRSENIIDVEIQTPFILQISMPGYKAAYAVPTNLIEEIRGKINNLIKTKDNYFQDAGLLLIMLGTNNSSRMISTKFNSQFLDNLVAGLTPIQNGSYF